MPFPHGLQIHLDRAASEPLYEQVRRQVADAVRSGLLAAGSRLPSTRHACEELAVNRATIVEAYRRLEEERLVERRQGSGTYVRALESAPAGGRAARASAGAAARPRAVVRPMPEARPVPPGAIDLAGLMVHERNYPSAELAECLQRVMAERGGSALAYGTTAGDARLREVLAERLGRRGMKVDASRILVVGGAQQGLDLLFRAFVHAGDSVVCESPTYHMALALLGLHGAHVTSVPLRRIAPGLSTLDFDALADALRASPSLAYAMPSFQNPTGLSLDAASRRKLAAACRDARVPLIEDDYEADMRHDGLDVAPIAALPDAGEVAYVGTLSKALFPGLRVGWVVGSPDLLAKLAQVKRLSDLSGSVLLQAAAAELLASGVYDRHLKKAVAQARGKMRALVSALERGLPSGGWSVEAPLGGHVTWLRIADSGLSGRELADRCAREGVIVTPGEAFQIEEDRDDRREIGETSRSREGTLASGAAVRVSIARVEESEIDEAAARLARAVTSCIEESESRKKARGDRAGAVELERPVHV